MGKKEFPTQKRLHELLERHYDENGKLYFVAKVKRKTVKVGDVLYGYEHTCNKGKPSEHTRFMLGIDGWKQNMAVWNQIYEYGDYDRFLYTVDHIDRDPLNDHHSNLRLLSKSAQNKNRNNYKKKWSSSGYNGVHFDKNTNKWRVQYHYKNTGKQKHIGLYTDEKAAAQAYDLASWKDRREPERLNFPTLIPIYNSLETLQAKYPDKISIPYLEKL